MSKFDIVWRIYDRTDKGQRGKELLGIVNASSKLDAEDKARQGNFRTKYDALSTYKGEFFAHV